MKEISMFKKTTVVEKPEDVKNTADLLEFIAFLSVDLKNNPDAWENISLEDYLFSIGRWIEDSNLSKRKQKKLSCEEVANLFFVGKIYE